MTTILFHCTSCQKPYRVAAEKAGLKAKCSRCGTLLHIPASSEETPEVASGSTAPPRRAGRRDKDDEPAPSKKAPPRREPRSVARAEDAEIPAARKTRSRPAATAETEDDTEQPRRRRQPRKRKHEGAWRKVSLGLLLLMVPLVVSSIVYILNWFVFSTPSFTAAGVARLLTWAKVMGLVGLVEAGVGIAGAGLCLFAPREHHCKQLALALLVVSALNLVTTALMDPMGLGSWGSNTGDLLTALNKGDLSGFAKFQAQFMSWMARVPLLSFFLQALGYAGLFLTPLFLWSLARCLGNRSLEGSAITLAKINIANTAVGLGWQFLVRVIPLTALIHLARPMSIVTTLLFVAQTLLTLFILINCRMAVADQVSD